MDKIVNEPNGKSKFEMARILIEAGLGIFPVSQEKKPLIMTWHEKNSTALRQIRIWYDQKNPPEIAVVTGASSGFFCLDVDGDEGKASLARLEERYGPLLKDCMVETPSGGWHIFFKMPDFDLRNSVGKLGPSLDIRANGGYVVVPPSSAVNRNGELRPYRYLTEVTLYSGELPQAPAWLLNMLKAAPPAVKPVNASTTGYGTPYGQKALEDECARVRQAVQGTRNDTLNRAAFAVFQLVAGGELDRSDAESALTTAALSAGLGEKEVRSTLKSAQVKALSQPRSAPQKPDPVDGYAAEKRKINLMAEPPLSVFPPKIQKVLNEAACAFKNLPVEVPIVALLSLLAACVGRSRMVVVKDNWEEAGNLYLGLVASSGLGKSPCFKEFLKPLWKEEERNKAKWDKEMAAYYEALDERRQSKDRSELGPPPVKPVRTQYIVEDATTEAIGNILSENPRGLLWHCDELSSIILNLDRYSNSKGGTKARLLSTYDGSPWKTSRRDNDRDQVIPSAVLSIAGTVQPKILKELFGQQDALSGFLPRFIFILTRRASPAFLNDSIFTGQEILEKIARHLLNWNLIAQGDQLQPKKIRLSAEAYGLYKQWHNQIMAEAWLESEVDSTIAAKLVTQVIRLALLLHCLKAALTESDGMNDIEAETMNEAITLGWWIRAHQRQIWLALDIESDPGGTPLEEAIIKAALDLEAFLEDNEWQVPNARFNDLVLAHLGQKIDLAQIGKASSRMGIKSIPMGKNRGKEFSRELLKTFKLGFFLSTCRQ